MNHTIKGSEPDIKSIEWSLDRDSEGRVTLYGNGLAVLKIDKNGYGWLIADTANKLGLPANKFGEWEVL